MKKINVKIGVTSNIKETANDIKKSSRDIQENLSKIGAKSFASASFTENSFASSFKKTSVYAKNLSRDLDKTFGSIANKGALVFTGLATGVTAFGKSALDTYSGFESSLVNTASIFNLDPASKEFNSLKNTALQTAAITSKTAKDSADALGYMARAGWSAKESMSALSDMIKFTEIAQTDLANTTDVITDSMDAFGLKSSEIRNYLDTISFADTKVNTSAFQIAESLKEVGGVFKNLNVNTSEAVSFVSSISSVAKGSEAGNALSTLFSRFSAGTGEAAKGLAKLGVSAYDSTGNVENMIDFVEELSASLSNLRDEERFNLSKVIGGLNYTAEFNTLMDWAKIDDTTGISKLRAMENSFAAESSNTLATRWGKTADTVSYLKDTTKSAWEKLQIDVIDGNRDSLVNFVTTLKTTIDAAVPEMTKSFGGLVNTSLPFVENVIKKVPTIIDWIPTISKVAFALTGLKLAIVGVKAAADMLTGIKLLGAFAMAHPLIAGAAAVAGGGYLAYKGLRNLSEKNDSLAASVGGELASKVDKSASIAYSPYSSVMTKRATDAASNNNTAYKKGVSQLLGNVKNAPTFATGTNYFKGGIAEINEHGGEMVVLPSGSKVIPSDKTNDIINNSSSSSRCVINLNIDTFIGNRQFLDNVIQEIDRVIGQKMAIN